MIHIEAAQGRWFRFSLMEQLANIGMDIERTIAWRNKGNREYSQHAFYRALELLDLTTMDPKNKGPKLRELLRVREALVDYFIYDNVYRSTDEQWHKYFFCFNYAAAVQKGR